MRQMKAKLDNAKLNYNRLKISRKRCNIRSEYDNVMLIIW